MREPDRSFFENYAGSGQPYDRVWKDYSYADELVALLKKNLPKNSPSLPLKIMILGAATGKTADLFARKLRAKVFGCEINLWAHRQIPSTYRKNILPMDMRKYLTHCQKNGLHFDLIFSNSLIYLQKKEISKFVAGLSEIGSYLHFHSSLRGDCCPDLQRTILESFSWWNNKIESNGFALCKIKGMQRSYIWKSKNCPALLVLK